MVGRGGIRTEGTPSCDSPTDEGVPVSVQGHPFLYSVRDNVVVVSYLDGKHYSGQVSPILSQLHFNGNLELIL